MRLVPRHKRWSILIGVVGAIGVVAWTLTRPTEMERKLERVQAGMTQAEAIALLGPPNTQQNLSDGRVTIPTSPSWYGTWYGNGEICRQL